MAIGKSVSTFNDKIKSIVVYRGSSYAELCREFNARYGTNYSPNSFRRKLSNETGLSIRDVQRFGEILGFKVNIVLDEDNQLPNCQSS